MVGDDQRTRLLDLLRGEPDLAEALYGGFLLFEDDLAWTERQHESGAWHVTVTLPDCPVFGNDGHLLSENRDECRFMAFVSLLSCMADPELNQQIEDES